MNIILTFETFMLKRGIALCRRDQNLFASCLANNNDILSPESGFNLDPSLLTGLKICFPYCSWHGELMNCLTDDLCWIPVHCGIKLMGSSSRISRVNLPGSCILGSSFGLEGVSIEKVCGHTCHRMSLLRPDVIKQYSFKTQPVPLYTTCRCI